MRLLSYAPLALLAACGSTQAGTQSSATPLSVVAGLGIDLYLKPAPSEGAGVGGLVTVTRHLGSGPEQLVSDATVTLEGVALAPAGPGQYDTDSANVRAVVNPGATLHLLAVKGLDSASVTFRCPDAVAITAPAEKSPVAHGQSLSVAWTGRVGYNAGVFIPQLLLRGWDASNDEVTSGYDPLNLSAAQTSASVGVPNDAQQGYVVELSVPGEQATQASTHGQALCILHQRVHVSVQ